ncbi:hypothetical protein DERF_006236 [Dermatophagoides farinae]|uniref:Uncharacterized protein n=1 Tax=Dermatophagoides farinae TaxID=6954 RepID=A0A922LC00_DERFA|nr:hypothetical protein DERF_006236 [Dermatophagoides farinae]
MQNNSSFLRFISITFGNKHILGSDSMMKPSATIDLHLISTSYGDIISSINVSRTRSLYS